MPAKKQTQKFRVLLLKVVIIQNMYHRLIFSYQVQILSQIQRPLSHIRVVGDLRQTTHLLIVQGCLVQQNKLAKVIAVVEKRAHLAANVIQNAKTMMTAALMSMIIVTWTHTRDLQLRFTMHVKRLILQHLVQRQKVLKTLYQRRGLMFRVLILK